LTILTEADVRALLQGEARQGPAAKAFLKGLRLTEERVLAVVTELRNAEREPDFPAHLRGIEVVEEWQGREDGGGVGWGLGTKQRRRRRRRRRRKGEGRMRGRWRKRERSKGGGEERSMPGEDEAAAAQDLLKRCSRSFGSAWSHGKQGAGGGGWGVGGLQRARVVAGVGGCPGGPWFE